MTDSKFFAAIKVIGFIYICVGFLNALYVGLFVSRNDCIVAEGVTAIYCNSGLAISHSVSILLWPFFWF